jgi:hypothetical protein
MKNIQTFESFSETTNETGEVFSSPTGRSGLGGQTIGTSWSSGGGGEPGQISAPYSQSGSNKVFQKIAAPEMGKNHGAHTGKKSREKKLDMKTLKSMFAKRQDYTAGEGDVDGETPRPSKVMSFDNFAKDNINTIKKESVNDVVLVEGDQPIVAYQRDVENDTLSLNDGYFTGTAIIGEESVEDRGSVDFSSPFHTGQVLHDDEEGMVEELDFRFHKSIPEDMLRKHLDEFVSKGYNGKIVKIYYH